MWRAHKSICIFLFNLSTAVLFRPLVDHPQSFQIQVPSYRCYRDFALICTWLLSQIFNRLIFLCKAVFFIQTFNVINKIIYNFITKVLFTNFMENYKKKRKKCQL